MKGEKALGLKRVIYSKNPTITQVQNMAHNLRVKYGYMAMVSIDAWATANCDRIMFKVYVTAAKTTYYRYATWQECYNAYVDLMKGRSL
jgi:hypothetical protein